MRRDQGLDYFQSHTSDIAIPPDLELPWRAYEGPHVEGCRGFEVIAVMIHDEVLHYPCSCRPLVAIRAAFADAPLYVPLKLDLDWADWNGFER